jgi:predicted ATP-grasp superfamily ATP-dependent carboligase
VSRPLTGRAWCGARGFAYCGSVDAPLDDVRDRVRRQFDRIGEALAAAFRLTGLFGVDTIIDPRGHVHVLEVNPRPTASMELYERATGTSIASLHLAACGFGDVRTPSPAIPGIWSKAIVFAPRGHRTITPSAARVAATGRTWADSDGAAAIADLPRGGQRLPPGAPLVTVFARGDTPARSLAILRTRVGAVRRLSTASVSRPSARLPRRRRHRARTA